MKQQALHISGDAGEENLPSVAVLIAARNEEQEISACLDALSKSDYPKQKIQVLVGDDASSDLTVTLVEKYAADFSFIRLVPIDHEFDRPLGKTNVLIQLARTSNAEVLLITDADVRVPPTWIRQMVQELLTGYEMVSGPTAVRQSDLFSSLQNADWLYNFYIRVLSEKFGIKLGVSGTNMAFFRKEYFAVGGFDAIRQSITEDYDLFRSMERNGYRCKSYNDISVLALTKPEQTFASLVHQQKRWLNSLPRMSAANLFGITIQNLLVILVIVMALVFKAPQLLLIVAVKWIVEILILLIAYKKFAQRMNAAIFLYTPYSSVCMPIFFIAWMFNRKNKWKGREYTT